MKINKYLMATIFVLAILTIGVASASDNATAEDAVALEGDSDDALADKTYYDDDFYVTVRENYTQDKENWDSYDVVYMASYSQKNGTVKVFVNDTERQSYQLTDGHFASEDDGNGGTYNRYYQYVYPSDLGIVDCGKYSIKVKFNETTLIEAIANVNEKDDFGIWLQNPYYCEGEYWEYPSFIVIDSNHQNTGTLEIFVNGTRKISYAVTNGNFEEIADCSNRSRYLSPSDLLSDYGTYGIIINFTENGVTRTLRNETVVVAEFEPTTDPKLDVFLDLYTVNLPADNLARIYLPREATGTLTVSYNNVKDENIPYSKGYGEHYIYAWNLNHLGENVLTFKYVGDDFGTMIKTVECIVVPTITAPSYVSVGEKFKISMTTHEWVRGNFNVYDYNSGNKGKLLASGVIANRVSTVELSSSTAGLNKFYLEFDYPGGNYPLIQEVFVVENSENITVDVPNEVEKGLPFNITIKAPDIDFTFAQVSIDGGDVEFLMFQSGEVKKNVSFSSSGYHTIKVFYENRYYSDGDWVGDIYLNTFTVNVGVKTNINASDVICDYNSGENLTITLKDADGNLLSEKEILINLDGTNYTRITDENGQARLAINLPGGNYTANISFKGDEGYLSSFTSAKVNVNKIKTNLTAGNVIVDYGGAIVVTLKDVNGNVLANKNITLKVNDVSQIRSTGGNGQVSFVIKLLPNDYSANITFAEDGGYLSSSLNPQIKVNKANTNLTVGNVIVDYGDAIVATLKDVNGNVLANKNITLKVNEVNQTRSTDDNGQVSFDIRLVPNKYGANVTFAGDEFYYYSYAVVNLTVLKINTQLTAPQVNTVYNVAKNLVITLKDSKNKDISGKSVIVKLNGKVHKITTDKNGQAKVSVNLPAKTYTAYINFAGDNNYLASSKNVKVVVAKATPKITAKTKTFKLKTKTKKFTATLKDNRSRVMKKVRLTLKVKGKTYKATTNAKGKATFKINKLNKKGTYKAKITFKANSNYKTATKTVKIKVK